MQEYMNREMQDERVNKLMEFMSILESTGINLSEQREYLTTILNRYNFNGNTKEALEIFAYELGTLMESLSPFINLVKFIKMIEELKELNYSEEKEEQVQRLIELLEEYRSSVEVEYPKNIIESALKCILDEIKEEIKNHLDSKTFDVVSKDEFYTKYFNELIKEEIEELKSLSFLCYPKMLETLQEEMNRCKNQLFDKRLITSLIACQEKEELMNATKPYCRSKRYTLDANNYRIKSLSDNDSLYATFESLKKYKELIFKAKKRVPSLLLTGILLSGISLGVPQLAKKISTKSLYKTTTEKYILYSDIHTESTLESSEELLNENGLQVTLTVQGELTKINHNHYHKTETVYDVTSKGVEEPYYYLYLDLENNSEITKISETTLEYTDEEYTGEIRYLTIIKQDLESKEDEFDEGEYIATCWQAYTTLFISTLLPGFPIFNLFNITMDLLDAHRNKENFKKYLNLLSEELEKCHKKILENEEIRDYYNFLLNSGIMNKRNDVIEMLLSELVYYQKKMESKEKEALELKKIKM